MYLIRKFDLKFNGYTKSKNIPDIHGKSIRN